MACLRLRDSSRLDAHLATITTAGGRPIVSEEVEDLCEAEKPFLGGFNAGNGKALVGESPHSSRLYQSGTFTRGRTLYSVVLLPMTGFPMSSALLEGSKQKYTSSISLIDLTIFPHSSA